MADNTTDFDPDAYLAVKEPNKGFDPDEYLANTAIGAQGSIAAKPSTTNTTDKFQLIPPREAGLAIASGATLGLAPALETAGKDIAARLGGATQQTQNLGVTPTTIADARQKYDLARQQYPGQFAALETGAGLATQVGAGATGIPTAISEALPAGAMRTGAKIAAESGLGAAQSATQGGRADVGAALGAVPGIVGTVARNIPSAAGTVVGGVTKALTPQASQGAVETFMNNPELLQQAKRAGVDIPTLQAAVKSSSGDVETAIQNTINNQKVRVNGLYENAKNLAATSKEILPDPANAISEQTRNSIEDMINDPEMRLHKTDLAVIANQVGVPDTQGNMINPKVRMVDTTAANATGQPTIQYNPITKGDNLNMALQFRRRLDDLIVSPMDYKNLSTEEKIAQDKLSDLRGQLSEQIKTINPDQFDPDAQQALQTADQEHAKLSSAQKVLYKNIGSTNVNPVTGSKQQIINANKIPGAAAQQSPAIQGRVNQALTNIGTPEALAPVQQNQTQIKNLQNLANQKQMLESGYNFPILKQVPAAGTELANKLNTGSDVATKALASKPAQVLGAVQRAAQPAELNAVANSQAAKDQQIRQDFPQNPQAVLWLQQVARSPQPTVSQSLINPTAKQAGVTPEKVSDTLIKLGKQIVP